MKIYDVYAYDGDYYDPLHLIGIYNDFETAKKEARQYSDNMDSLHVDVLEVIGSKFEVKEEWAFRVGEYNPVWKKKE